MIGWEQQMWDEEWGTTTKLDLYLARICYQLYLILFMLGGDPDKTWKDFILDFKHPSNEDTEVVPEKTYEEERTEMQEALKKSKAAWLAAAGVGAKKIASRVVKEAAKAAAGGNPKSGAKTPATPQKPGKDKAPQRPRPPRAGKY